MYKKKRRIVDKIDKDKDGHVTEKELRNWIRFQQKLYMQKYADERWEKVNTNKDSLLEFDEMINSTIGGYDSCIKT
jgi:Ca2+-binding EF-hand superfamily protein